MALAAVLPSARSEELDAQRFATLFRPFGGNVTLAPDGHHLAYTIQDDDEASVVVVDVDDPASGVKIPSGVRVTELRWANDKRLIIQTDAPGQLEYGDGPGSKSMVEPTEIFGIDADGKNMRRLASAMDIAYMTTVGRDTPIVIPRRPQLETMLPDDPDFIVVGGHAPSVGQKNRDRFATALFRVNINTGQRQKTFDDDIDSQAVLFDQQGRPRLQYLRRQNPQVFLLAANAKATGWLNLNDEIGKAVPPAFSVTPENYLGHRSIPLGFDHDPDILYFVSNVGRDTYGIYALNLRTKKRESLAVENPRFDLFELGDAVSHDPLAPAPLVFDRSRHTLVGIRYTGDAFLTAWVDPELARVQSDLDGRLAGKNARILEWDSARSRFLVLVSEATNPGRYYIFDPAKDRLEPFLSAAPWLAPEDVNASEAFALDASAQTPVTGFLTRPNHSRLAVPPLIVLCHDGPWSRDEPGFSRWAQALADMGFVVEQVNYRGSTGLGVNHREALRAGYDRVPLEDIEAAIGWARAHAGIDPKRIAVMGQGYGGYLALRALQLHPDEFRCAVSLDAPTDLNQWRKELDSPNERRQTGREAGQTMEWARNATNTLRMASSGANPAALARAESRMADAALDARSFVDFGIEFRKWFFGNDTAQLAEISPLRHPELLTKPVYLIQDLTRRDLPPNQASDLRDALVRLKQTPEYLDYDGDFMARHPDTEAEIFSRIEEFLNLNVYDYKVQLGEPRRQD